MWSVGISGQNQSPVGRRLQRAKVASCFLRHYELVFSLSTNDSLPLLWHLKQVRRFILTPIHLLHVFLFLHVTFAYMVILTGIGPSRLGITVLSLGPKRKPWSSIFSDCLLQNDELRGAITGSSCGEGDKRGIKMNPKGQQQIHRYHYYLDVVFNWFSFGLWQDAAIHNIESQRFPHFFHRWSMLKWNKTRSTFTEPRVKSYVLILTSNR